MMIINLLICLLVITYTKALLPQEAVNVFKTLEKNALYRLPNDVIPVNYVVDLKADVNENFVFEGSVSIVVNVLVATNNIILHSNGLTYLDPVVVDIQTDQQVTTTHGYTEQTHFLTISSQIQFEQGKDYRITITFHGTLAEDMYGFYRSSYIDADNNERWIGATQFQPTHARRVFPCFDEPAFKATFKITISTPAGYHALSNMPLANNPSTGSDNFIHHEFEETEVMSTYLIAFIVSDFESMTDSDDQYSFSAWARPEAIEKAEYSQSIGPSLVNFFEEYTGIKYTFPKIDQVALPDFAAGAMENWGLITYRETGLLYYEEATTESNKKSIALVIAHELAHMWFGNLVTLNWWEDTWLNEGFARYFQYFSLEDVETEWRLMDQFLVDQQHTIFATDALTNAQPLSSECNSPAEIQAKFGSISYNKGGSVLRMLSHILTPETFKKGLMTYLSRHSSGNTIPTDLFSALEEQRLLDQQGSFSVSEFFGLWTTQPGYPVVNVERNGNAFSVSQVRFLLKPDENAEALTWYVPLTWTTQSQGLAGFETTQPLQWLTTNSVITIEAEETEWVIFNNQETGYYRVNYDSGSWKLIINSLHNNPSEIHVLNRAQLIDDSLNLARAGSLDYTVALDLADYLMNEEDYIPWFSAFNAFSFLDRRLTSEEGHLDFKTYLLGLIDNTYTKLGFEEGTDDQQDTKLHRVSLLTWACRFDYEECINNAMQKFEAYFSDETALVPANLRNVVYCTALRRGGSTEWDFLWNKYTSSKIATEKVVILSALGCTEDQDILERYLQMSIDDNSGIRKQDAASVFSAVYINPKGVDKAFEFLQNNYVDIANYYGGMNAISNILTGIAGRLTTEEQVLKFDEFITTNENELGAAAEAGRIAAESSKADLAWTNEHKDVILNWYKQKVNPSAGSKQELSSLAIMFFVLTYIIQFLN